MAGRDTRRTLRQGFRQALPFLEVASDPHDVLVGAGITLLCDLPVDLCGVATSLLPAPQDVVLVGRDGAHLLGEVVSFGRGLEGQILLHSVAVYPELSGHLGVLDALLRKGVNGVEE